LAHYRTAPKYKVTTMLENHMNIYTLHPLCAWYRFTWLLSFRPSHPYNFTLKNFSAQLICTGVAENEEYKT